MEKRLFKNNTATGSWTFL